MMKTCIITGVTSGIGKEVAIKLSTMKYFEHIALLGRNLVAVEQVKCEIENSTITVSAWQADLENPQTLPAIISSIYKKSKSIDCLLNIAGYTDPQPLLTTTMDNLLTTYTINVFSPIILIKETVKYMKKNGGKILNVASTAGMTPRPGWLSYASSKAAVISMSQTLTEELAEYGIKVYCISPGRCATKLRKRLAPDEDSSLIMQPQEVAEIICMLISNNENCLDGQNIIVRKKITN